ncbi:MAG: tetratricopeptide repeat protein [Nitrosomonadales bacterium]|nr:tetratricopeptide repeat protein [Nitrosomonadales bacterium]
MMLVSVTVAMLAYLQAAHFPFFADDKAYIEYGPLTELAFSDLWKLFLQPYNPFSEFLPLRDFSYRFDIKSFGLNPFAFRMHNLVLYLLCSPLIYFATKKLFECFPAQKSANTTWMAATVTALFMLHPSHTEAVVWISGRKDVMAGLFSILAIWLSMHTHRNNGFSVRYASATLIALLAAIFSKASAVTVAPVISLLWLLFWKDIPAASRHRSLLIWPLSSLALGLFTAWFFATSIERAPFYLGAETASRFFAILGWMARLAISSESRHFYYPVFENASFPYMVALGIAVLFTSVIGVILIFRKRALWSFAVPAFFLICIPSLQLIPYSPPSLVSDRFIFLAAWPAIMLVVAIAWRIKPLPRIIFLMVILVTWSYGTITRVPELKNHVTIVKADFRAYPNYYMPATYAIVDITLPDNYYDESIAIANTISIPELRDVMLKIIDIHHGADADAIESGKLHNSIRLLWELKDKIKQYPDQAKWDMPVANLWKKLLKFLSAEWEVLVRSYPDNALVAYNAGVWSLEMNVLWKAVEYLEAATKSPNLPKDTLGSAYHNLGIALLRSQRPNDAEKIFIAAIKAQRDPQSITYCALAEVYRQTQRQQDAADAEEHCKHGEAG